MARRRRSRRIKATHAHAMTPARRAALRKAQLASAAKRRKHGTKASAAQRAELPAPVAAKRNRRRRRAAVAGSAVVAGAVAVGQARNPASRTRAAITRRKLVNRHVARAAADHEHLTVLRAKSFPTEVSVAAPFDSAARKAARAEARRLTAGFRRRAKAARKRNRAKRR